MEMITLNKNQSILIARELTLSYVRDKTANMGKLYETTQKYSRYI